jgi:hypothetical protein
MDLSEIMAAAFALACIIAAFIVLMLNSVPPVPPRKR